MKNLFVGVRADSCLTTVRVNGEELNPRHELVNHSPDGFNWGYGGSGPAQLAFAMLAEEYGEDWDLLGSVYQEFKKKAIEPIKDPIWIMTSDEVRKKVEGIQGDMNLLV